MAEQSTEPTDASTDDQPVACSLTAGEARDRLDWVEETLVPDMLDITVADDHLTWTFERTDDAIAGVTELTAREARCCAFATIEVTIPPAEPISFRMDVPDGAGPALARQFDDIVDIEELV